MRPVWRSSDQRPTVARALGVALLLGACATDSAPRPEIGDEALARPPLRLALPRLGGGSVAFAALRGRPVVVFMFTTWSLRAQLEAAQFVRLQQTRGEIHVVGIALDRGNRPLIRAFVDFVGLRGDVALAEPDDLDLVGAFGRTDQVPRTLLLDGAGRVRQDHRGQTDFPRLERGLAGLR
jgi:hypothetical protein